MNPVTQNTRHKPVPMPEGSSDAEDLLEAGRRYLLSDKCSDGLDGGACDGCKQTRRTIERKMRKDVIQLAIAWTKAPALVLFRGQMDGWDDKRIAKELGISIKL